MSKTTSIPPNNCSVHIARSEAAYDDIGPRPTALVQSTDDTSMPSSNRDVRQGDLSLDIIFAC